MNGLMENVACKVDSGRVDDIVGAAAKPLLCTIAWTVMNIN